MSSDVSILIQTLQKSSLLAECPRCREEFSLSECIMFDGRQKFPNEAEIVRQQWQKELDDKITQLQKRQLMADEGAEKKAIEVGIGKIIEKVLPAYKNFNMQLSDCRFLSEPIDMIVFRGASDMKIDHITFMDIKTGKAKLNTHQRQIRDAIKDHQVRCEVV
ncbi:MAG: Holliday junction resolvase-like protein [Candidatus Nitrosotenuis sp.]